MSDQVPDYVRKTIQEACSEVDRLDVELAEKKRGVNAICKLFGVPLVFQDISQSERIAQNSGRPDRYFNKPLATVVRTILAARHDADIGPIHIDELHREMLDGGYDFEGKSVENCKRALAVSLSKNTNVFLKMKNGAWGLCEWYGDIKASRGKSSKVMMLPNQSTTVAESESPDIDPAMALFMDDVDESENLVVNKPR